MKKKATTDIFGKTFYRHMFAFLLGIHIEVGFINNKVDVRVFLSETAKELSKVKVPFCIYTTMYESFNSCTSSQHLYCQSFEY